jgi:hypothetical protein
LSNGLSPSTDGRSPSNLADVGTFSVLKDDRE